MTPGSDLVLEDGEVSGQHARITPSPDGYATVEDLESTNGTFVNQNELMGPARLDPGDELLIGVSVIQLRTGQDIASGLRRDPDPAGDGDRSARADLRQPGSRSRRRGIGELLPPEVTRRSKSTST